MTCLICKRTIADYEKDYCSTRQTDGEKVCPTCTARVRAGDRDALDKLHDAKPIQI